MRAVDTNVLVRLVTRDDRKQVAAAESFVSKGAWVSTLVLMEATWVLTAVYDLTHAEIATAIDMLLHHRDLTLQESDSVAAAPRAVSQSAGVGVLRLLDSRNDSESRPSSIADIPSKSFQTRRRRRAVAVE